MSKNWTKGPWVAARGEYICHVTMPEDQYQHLLDCYRSGQIEESAWQEHLQDKGFREWVEGQGKPKKKRKFQRHTLRDPRKVREGEEIGGGWWVFRRGDGTGRVRVPMWPYEHSSRDDAAAQATRLAMKNPGETFVVVGEVGSVSISDGDATFVTRRESDQ